MEIKDSKPLIGHYMDIFFEELRGPINRLIDTIQSKLFEVLNDENVKVDYILDIAIGSIIDSDTQEDTFIGGKQDK